MFRGTFGSTCSTNQTVKVIISYNTRTQHWQSETLLTLLNHNVFLSRVCFCVYICVYTVWVCVYVCSHACCRHCAAVARRSGCSSNMVNRKSLNWAAWSSGHSYFSNRTSKRPHGFRLEMWRSSPETVTERWDRWWGTWKLSGCVIRTETERVQASPSYKKPVDINSKREKSATTPKVQFTRASHDFFSTVCLTSPVEVLSGVPARQREGHRNRTEQLDDVSDVIYKHTGSKNTHSSTVYQSSCRVLLL